MIYTVSLKDKEAFIHGVDLGNGSKSILLWKSLPIDLENLDEAGIERYTTIVGHAPIIVLKIPSGYHFQSRGQQAYHGVSFLVLELKSVTIKNDKRFYLCQDLIDFDVREKL